MSDLPVSSADGSAMGGHPAYPLWLSRAPQILADNPPPLFERLAPPEEPRRESAVLMLFGPTGDQPVGADGITGVDVVLTARSQQMRSHAGQVSFPGGRLEEADSGPVAAALRESQEEVGLDPGSVEIVHALPRIYLAPSGNAVTPVLAWWTDPHPLTELAPIEVDRVARVPLAELLDPANRWTVTSPTGFRGPAFEVDDLFVWGFTAMLLDGLFDATGLTRPWDSKRQRPIPREVRPSVGNIVRYMVRRNRR